MHWRGHGWHTPKRPPGHHRQDKQKTAFNDLKAEFGWKSVVDRVSVHDLHATMLHLLGIDHKRLTYLHNGRRFRLTDVAGEVLTKILA